MCTSVHIRPALPLRRMTGVEMAVDGYPEVLLYPECHKLGDDSLGRNLGAVLRVEAR